ncbi:MAG: carbohydrate ABC transporter permease, partial [Actinobacteria bacterium]|nr:carbohydrate ABC transporter permease [Actinomycetota bacterium]
SKLIAPFVLVGSWNDYFWQLVLIRSNKLYPLPIALASLMQEKNLLVGYQLAGAFIATVPILIIFVVLQKYFLEGVTIGALKG